MRMAALVILVGVIFNLTYYIFLIPSPSGSPFRPRPLKKHVGTLAYIVTYVLSLVRTPLGIVPYLIKLFIFFGLKINYRTSRNSYLREVVHIFGDYLNLALTALLVSRVIESFALERSQVLFYLPLIAELIRLVPMRGQMIFSAVWQIIPHRTIALYVISIKDSHSIGNLLYNFLYRYCSYYSLEEVARSEYILLCLRNRARLDREMLLRLSYINTFTIVPNSHPLNGGKVRDVAKGEIFIHKNWTNDPWLLAGMAVRRSPWIFDPRFLRRPFYYRSESAGIVTIFVLRHACYYPPFAVFQFGDQINVARHEPFYKVLRYIGFDIEPKVQADGTHRYDPFICWLEEKSGIRNHAPEQQPLWADSETIADIRHNINLGRSQSTCEIAQKYIYPVKYVDEVLIKKLQDN